MGSFLTTSGPRLLTGMCSLPIFIFHVDKFVSKQVLTQDHVVVDLLNDNECSAVPLSNGVMSWTYLDMLKALIHLKPLLLNKYKFSLLNLFSVRNILEQILIKSIILKRTVKLCASNSRVWEGFCHGLHLSLSHCLCLCVQLPQPVLRVRGGSSSSSHLSAPGLFT